jgi:hypothetical protein
LRLSVVKEVGRIASSIARYAPHPAAQARAEGRDGGASSQPDGGRQVKIRFVPFPTATLPQPVRDYVEESAESIGCCPSFVALPLLTCHAMGHKPSPSGETFRFYDRWLK